LRKYIPDVDTVRSSRLVAPFGGGLRHPNLWCVNRKSVPGAVAIGLFCGLIPGPLQMIGALLFAIALRKNIPVSLLVTLYTNPITIVPLYLLAYGYGQLPLGATHGAMPFERSASASRSPSALSRLRLRWRRWLLHHRTFVGGLRSVGMEGARPARQMRKNRVCP
jgi:uncharacterized protein (DUF2062 family)